MLTVIRLYSMARGTAFMDKKILMCGPVIPIPHLCILPPIPTSNDIKKLEAQKVKMFPNIGEQFENAFSFMDKTT